MAIEARHVEQGLETVGNRLTAILDYRAPVVIAQARSMLRQSQREHAESTRQGRRERSIRPWGYRIDPEDPLRFRETVVDGARIQVDLVLKAFWGSEPAHQPAELNVVLRVWSLDPHIYFREEWDAGEMAERVYPDRGRVMLRLHFDLANAGQPGPHFHLQVGGNPWPEELHWFPKALRVPRVLHTPMDLVLASELVAATFYPTEFERIRREDSWRISRNTSQEHLLTSYFRDAFEAVSANKSVLETLWNVSWDD